MGYQISHRNSSQEHAKLHLCISMIFPILIASCNVLLFQVLVFPASLPSPAEYTTDILSCRVCRDGKMTHT